MAAPGETRPQRDYRRPLAIDFSILGAAQAFYASRGFVDTAVPWVVGEEAYADTLPADVEPYATLGGFLVASGEQSFLHAMLCGAGVGAAQATTPCFRDEPHDGEHFPYFMKTELILGQDASAEGVAALVQVAEQFLGQYVETDVVAFGDGTFDIVSRRGRMELGSYGARIHGDLKWCYGTGVALPRLNLAMALEAKLS